MVILDGWDSSFTSRAPVVWALLKAHEPYALLAHPKHASVLLPTPVRQMTYGKLHDLCNRSRPVSQIMILVFSVFTQPLPIHTLLPSQQSIDIFLHRDCNNDNAICIRALSKKMAPKCDIQGEIST